MINKKAFTLAETIVSLALIIMVLALVGTMVNMVTRATAQQQYESRCAQEYLNANDLVEQFFSTYSTSECRLESVEQNTIIVENDGQTFELSFKLAQKKLSADIKNYQTNISQTKEMYFENITEISFSAQNDIIKCEYKYEKFATRSNIFKFGVF